MRLSRACEIAAYRTRTHRRRDWTSRGLFIWGSTPEETEPFAGLYSPSSDSWSKVPASDGPRLRKYHRLVEGEDEVFPLGGWTRAIEGKSEEYVRELWRYSFEEEAWTELEIRSWAEPLDGVWVDGKLAWQALTKKW